jgi:hypothetical protein
MLLAVAGNNLTINRAGTDTIGAAATSKVINSANTGCQLAADTDPAPDRWTVLEFGAVGDGTVTRAKLSTGAVSTNNYSSKTANYTLTSDDDVVSVDATSGAITITLPAAASHTGREYFITKSDSSANEVTIDANGAETINGSLTRKLALQYDSIKIVSNGNNWIVLANNSTSEVIVDSGNGHGSTNTKIRRFSNTRRSIGGAITYSASAVNGDSFTINEPGEYAISYSDMHSSSDEFFGITINDSALTTNVGTPLTYAQGLRAMTFNVSTRVISLSWTGRLSVNDVIRAHTNGTANGTDAKTMFTVSKVRE